MPVKVLNPNLAAERIAKTNINLAPLKAFQPFLVLNPRRNGPLASLRLAKMIPLQSENCVPQPAHLKILGVLNC